MESVSYTHLDVYKRQGLERVSDHATNIAFSLLEKDPDEMQKNATAAG